METFHWIVIALAGVVYLSIVVLVLFSRAGTPAIDRTKPWPAAHTSCPVGWTRSGDYCVLAIPRTDDKTALVVPDARATGTFVTVSGGNLTFSVPVDQTDMPTFYAAKTTTTQTTFDKDHKTAFHTLTYAKLDDTSTSWASTDSGWIVAFDATNDPKAARDAVDPPSAAWWARMGLTWE